MKDSKLRAALEELGLKMHLSRMKCLEMIIMGVILSQSVNMVKIAAHIPSRAKQASHYERIRRFIKVVSFDQQGFIKIMLHLVPQQKLRVCLDRTNWQFGVVDINILMLAFVHKGVAIPLAFVMLDKQGNSNTVEREALLTDVLAQIPPERIEMFTADREFVGEAYLPEGARYPLCHPYPRQYARSQLLSC